MNLLAFDTSTDVMSIAVGRGLELGGTAQVWQHTGPGSAQASANLIPEIQRLMAEAGLRFDDLDAVVFGRGPGSFTGLRTACSVAQGLAFGAGGGAGVPVLPVDTLLAVAEEARHQQLTTLSGAQPEPQPVRVVALLDARMDEVYAGYYVFDSNKWKQHEGYGLVRPEDLALPEHGWLLAGNAFAAYGARLAAGLPRIAALPTASAMLRLAPALLAAGEAVAAQHAMPTYIRDKVAQTTQERADIKARLQAAP